MLIVEGSAAIDVMDHHGLVLVDISGELTTLEAPALTAAVASALEGSPRNLQVGLYAVTSMDSSGIHALLRISDMAQAAGVPMQLLGPTPCVCRLLDLTGLAGAFDTIG